MLKFSKKIYVDFICIFFLNPGRIRYIIYLKSGCVEKKSWYFGYVIYKKILLIKITVAVYHPMGTYIGINPWDCPLAKYMTSGHVFCLGTDPLGLIPIVSSEKVVGDQDHQGCCRCLILQWEH